MADDHYCTKSPLKAPSEADTKICFEINVGSGMKTPVVSMVGVAAIVEAVYDTSYYYYYLVLEPHVEYYGGLCFHPKLGADLL